MVDQSQENTYLREKEVKLKVDAHHLGDPALHHVLEVGVEAEDRAVDGDDDVLGDVGEGQGRKVTKLRYLIHSKSLPGQSRSNWI